MKNPTRFLFGMTLASGLALTAGCSNDIPEQRSAMDASSRIDALQAQAIQDGSELTGIRETGRPANIRVREGLYLGHEGFRTGRGDPLPRKFEKTDAISLNNGGKTDLTEISQFIKRLTGIPVDFRDLFSISAEVDEKRGGGRDDSTGQGDDSEDPAISESGSNGLIPHPLAVPFPMRYTGSLSGLLDYVASQAGVDWEYRGGKIRFLGAQTYTYTLWGLPGITSTQSTIGGAANIFGGSAPALTSLKMETDYWEGVEDTLGAIVPPVGSSFQINRANGTIVVTAPQSVHEKVVEFIESENARLSRQVAIKVDILSFSRRDGNSRSTDFDLALEKVAAGLGVDLVSPVNDITGSTGISTTVLDKDSGILEDFTGSQAIIRALAEQGRTALLDSTSVIAMNNTPTPVSITNEKAYVVGESQETDEEGNTTYSLETGIVNNGINMVVTPRILSGGEINISYTLNLSELVGLETFTTADGSNTVQLPEVNTRNFMQALTMGSGDSMVIASYDRSVTQRNASSPFNPRLWGLGGSDAFNTEDARIIVLMTPVVVENQNAPRIRRR